MAFSQEIFLPGMTEEGNEKTNSHPKTCKCVLCNNDKFFDLNADLLANFLAGKLAIFAGAGISTEGSNIVGYTFYDEIKSALGHTSDNLEFPDLIAAFCAQPNGRLKFIEKINNRFRHIRSTPEFYWLSTRFHRAIAPISIIDTIITTNWDNFFEQECWATPFVFAEDTAFWEAADRKLLKIHGTIENLGSIVASRADYEKCQSELSKGLIGSRLKTILSEKTVVFCGYSLKDFDFQEIMRFVQQEMKGFQRQAYIVTLDDSEGALQRYQEFNVIPIITDGSFFINSLYDEWVKIECIASKTVYDDCADLLKFMQDCHIDLADRLSMFDYPSLIYALFYQDGLIHSLQRIDLLRKTGAYSNRHMTSHKVSTYEDLRKKAIRLRRYDDAAYIEGYINGLLYSINSKEDSEGHPPFYFAFGKDDIRDFEDLELVLKDPVSLHSASSKKAIQIVSQYERTEGFVLDHACRLFGLT